jgi:hypothetical protein
MFRWYLKFPIVEYCLELGKKSENHVLLLKLRLGETGHAWAQ